MVKMPNNSSRHNGWRLLRPFGRPNGRFARNDWQFCIKRTILLVISVFLAVIACSQQEKTHGPTPKGKIPDSILEKATIVMTSFGIKQAVVYAETLYVFQTEDSVSAREVKVDFYDDKGVYQSTLTAKLGLVRQKQESFWVWGDVVVQNDTSRLDTQSLHWDSKRNLITTDDFVKFQRGEDIVTGDGLETDNKLQNVRILRNVKGRIKEIPKSEEQLDSLETPKSKESTP
jgi:LPS export ABC transporter protein LptC